MSQRDNIPEDFKRPIHLSVLIQNKYFVLCITKWLLKTQADPSHGYQYFWLLRPKYKAIIFRCLLVSAEGLSKWLLARVCPSVRTYQLLPNTDGILIKFCTGEFCQALLSRLNVSSYLVILATISRESIYAFLGAARANLVKPLPKQRKRRTKLAEKP